MVSTSTIAVMSTSASDYTPGDVDMDGVVTGHDAAMVSRYLNVDSDLLTEDQLLLADVNADGTVDQTDADLIHENEVYGIGNVSGTEKSYGSVELFSAYTALVYYAADRAGMTITVTDADPQALTVYAYETITESNTINALVFNLIDADGDGAVSFDDAVALANAHSVDLVESTEGEYYVNGRYDLTWDVLRTLPYLSGDGDEGIYLS